MPVATAELPLVVDAVEVRAVHRLSPSFVRVELGGSCLADFGVDGPFLDQRIKLVFPRSAGLPDLRTAGANWYAEWRALPDEERGDMRTYTVRDLVGGGDDVRLLVDIVVHEGGPSGPGADWALAAKPGDRVIVAGPRKGHFWGGIEFDPGAAKRLLIVADETAVPAVAGILRDLPADAQGTAYLEVPYREDILPLDGPAGVDLVWLPRDGGEPGSAIHDAVVEHFGGHEPEVVVLDEIDPELWETPAYSSSGEEVPADPRPEGDLYAWIAGEAGMVTGLRRHLVKDLGIDRRQVAFMGYWRVGRAMSGG